MIDNKGWYRYTISTNEYGCFHFCSKEQLSMANIRVSIIEHFAEVFKNLISIRYVRGILDNIEFDGHNFTEESSAEKLCDNDICEINKSISIIDNIFDNKLHDVKKIEIHDK